MDPFHGIEVGAEVELNDSTTAVEDHTAIKLENKGDLPLWHHIHHFDDSSSDESLDAQNLHSAPSEFETLEMPSHATDIKCQVMENDHLEKNIYVLSTVQPGLFYVNGEPRENHSLVLNNTYNKGLQEQAFCLAPYFEEPEMSCTEVISPSNFGQLQPYTRVEYKETTLSCEDDTTESLGKYSYFDAKMQCNRSVNPMERSYKCQRCGRQFGRLYNLENHMCIKMAVGCPPQNSNNLETMNRLEKMCAEAQKELHSLQGQYKKEVVGTEESSSEIFLWNQELLSASERVVPGTKCTVPCDHQECHISLDTTNIFPSQNLTALGNSIVVDLTNCSPIFPETNLEQASARQENIQTQLDHIQGEWTNSNQHFSFQISEEIPVETINTTREAITMYKCQECGKVYNKRCSITNHMRWHIKENNFRSSVVNALLGSSPGGQKSYGTTHHVGSPSHSLKQVNIAKQTQMFTCEYCGKVFNKHCSYATHTLWHLKNKEPAVVTSTQGANQETGQVSSLLVAHQKSDKASTSPVETFTCQYCEKVFNNRCAFVSHSRWHVKEQEFQKGVIAKAQAVLLEGDTENVVNHDNLVFEVDSNKEGSNACFDDSNVQGYCVLVRQLSLDEQRNNSVCEEVDEKFNKPHFPQLAMQMEANQQMPPEVLESVLELVVGTEGIHEILLSEEDHVFRKAEGHRVADNVVKDVALVSQIQVEPAERWVLRTEMEPAERRIPGTEMEPAETQVPGMGMEPAERQVTGMEPAERQVTGMEPAERQVTGMEPAERQVTGIKPAERQVTGMEPAERQVTGMEPAERQVTGMEPAERQVTGMEPAERQVTGMEPAERQVPGTGMELAERQIHGRLMEPGEKQIPGMEMEPGKIRVPGTQLKPALKQLPEAQIDPPKRQYSLPILSSKLAVQRSNRPILPHRCLDCGIRFSQSWKLKRHRLKDVTMKRSLKKHRCDCGRTPIGSLHFLLHQLQHLNDTAFTCAVCSKPLRGYRQLQAHSWDHPLASQFQCRCGARFTKLPKYLWHSLKNMAKPRSKPQLRAGAGAPL